jgi:hypothetical protein
VMFHMPIVPVQVTIQSLHRCETTHHKGMRAIDVVWSIGSIAYLLRRMLGSVEVLASEIS